MHVSVSVMVVRMNTKPKKIGLKVFAVILPKSCFWRCLLISFSFSQPRSLFLLSNSFIFLLLSVSLRYSNKIIKGKKIYTHCFSHRSSGPERTNCIKGSDVLFSTEWHHFDFPLGSPFPHHLAYIDGTQITAEGERERERTSERVPRGRRLNTSIF